MNRSLATVRSPVLQRGSRIRWLPLPVAVVCFFACSDDGEPPQACGRIPQQTLGMGQDVILTPCFEDPEGEELTLSATSSDVGVATVAVSGAAVRIRAVSAGSATIAVVATDPGGLTATLDIEVTVVESGPGNWNDHGGVIAPLPPSVRRRESPLASTVSETMRRKTAARR